MAELAANKNKSALTKISLFFATKSLHPYMSFDKVELYNAGTCHDSSAVMPTEL